MGVCCFFKCFFLGIFKNVFIHLSKWFPWIYSLYVLWMCGILTCLWVIIKKLQFSWTLFCVAYFMPRMLNCWVFINLSIYFVRTFIYRSILSEILSVSLFCQNIHLYLFCQNIHLSIIYLSVYLPIEVDVPRSLLLLGGSWLRRYHKGILLKGIHTDIFGGEHIPLWLHLRIY